MLSSHLLFHQFLGVRPQSLHELIVLSLWIHQIHTPSRAREIAFSPYPFGLDLRTRRQIELRESSIFHRLLYDGIQDHAHNSEHRPMESGAPEIRLHDSGVASIDKYIIAHPLLQATCEQNVGKLRLAVSFHPVCPFRAVHSLGIEDDTFLWGVVMAPRGNVHDASAFAGSSDGGQDGVGKDEVAKMGDGKVRFHLVSRCKLKGLVHYSGVVD
jgi:hypothetical protein